MAPDRVYPEDGHRRIAEVEESSFWFRHRAECVLTLLAQVQVTGTVVDLGGGNGLVAKRVQDAGHEVLLVEPAADAVRRAQARGVRSTVCAAMEEAGLEPDSVHAATLLDVLEHLDDPAARLGWLCSRLRPGAPLVITVPALPALWSGEDVHLGHRRRYTARSLRRALVEAGFRVDRLSYLFAPLVLPVFALRAAPSALGLRRHWPKAQGPEHAAMGLSGLLRPVLARERRRLAAGRSIRLGTSLIALARRAPPASE